MRVVQTRLTKRTSLNFQRQGLGATPTRMKKCGLLWGRFYGTLASHVSFRKLKEVGRLRSKKETRVRKAGASRRDFAQGVGEQAWGGVGGGVGPEGRRSPPSVDLRPAFEWRRRKTAETPVERQVGERPAPRQQVPRGACVSPPSRRSPAPRRVAPVTLGARATLLSEVALFRTGGRRCACAVGRGSEAVSSAPFPAAAAAELGGGGGGRREPALGAAAGGNLKGRARKPGRVGLSTLGVRAVTPFSLSVSLQAAPSSREDP